MLQVVSCPNCGGHRIFGDPCCSQSRCSHTRWLSDNLPLETCPRVPGPSGKCPDHDGQKKGHHVTERVLAALRKILQDDEDEQPPAEAC